MKILLVEDHQDSRRNLQRLIERRGHEVVAFASAEEAESALAQERFPFLILDWMLPGKSGVDLCRELRAQPNGDEMFIWLVTGRADTKDLEEALEAGANDYLTKPLDAGRLDVRLSVAERQIRDLASATRRVRRCRICAQHDRDSGEHDGRISGAGSRLEIYLCESEGGFAARLFAR